MRCARMAWPRAILRAVVHNGHEYLELLLAAGQVGMVMVPVNYRLGSRRDRVHRADSGAKVVVAAAEQARELPVAELPPIGT